MAVWRTKANSLFGFKPGDYSYRDGKRIRFADLVEVARKAVNDHDNLLLSRVVQYVAWAAEQNSDELASVVDLSFFLPVFTDPNLFAGLKHHFPDELIAEKWKSNLTNNSNVASAAILRSSSQTGVV